MAIRGRYREEFEKDGVDVVRDNVARHPYLPTSKQDSAKAWLHEQDSAVKRRHERETVDIARSAKNASWVAIFISLLALLLSVLGLKFQ